MFNGFSHIYENFKLVILKEIMIAIKCDVLTDFHWQATIMGPVSNS